jgi:hypothetical protein
MRRKRDTQRRRVYTAEQGVPGRYVSDPSWHRIEDVRRFYHRVMKSRWWLKRFGAPVPVVLERKRGRWVYHDPGRIRVGRVLSRWSALHELGHHICGEEEGHGNLFAATYLRLVRRWLGRDSWLALRQSFRVHRVHYRMPNKKEKNP